MIRGMFRAVVLYVIVSCISIVAPCASAASQPYLLLAPMVGHTGDADARIWAKASGPARLSILIGSKEDLSDGRMIKGALDAQKFADAVTLARANLKAP